jgi:putative oxidoreductase
MRNWLFGTIVSGPQISQVGLLIIRAGVGLIMAFSHGLGKFKIMDGFAGSVGKLGFPMPTFFAWAAALSEFLGGLLLALGLLTRPAAAVLLVTMLVAAFGQHARDPFQVKEMALLYATIALGFLLIGSGRFGIDPLLADRRS